MEINFVIDSQGHSGGKQVVFEIAERLKIRGHEVNVIYPALFPKFEKDLHNIRERILQFGGGIIRSINHVSGRRNPWAEFDVDRRLLPTITPSTAFIFERAIPDADIVVATSWQTAYFIAALSDSKGEKCYFVQHYEIWPIWRDRDCWERVETSGGNPSVRMTEIEPHNEYLSHYKKLVDDSYSIIPNLFVTSKWEREVLDRLDYNVDAEIKLGVDTTQFQPECMSSPLTVLALYRNSMEKGDKEAISAFKSLHEQYPEIEFIMFGRKKASAVPEFIEFYENPSIDMIANLYARSDIFVYPSWVEGYGMPPMEAMAAKNAIVSTKVGAVHEYTPENGVEFIPIQNTKAIINSVTSIIENQDRMQDMQNKCHQYIQQFTWEDTTNQFESAVLDLV